MQRSISIWLLVVLAGLFACEKENGEVAAPMSVPSPDELAANFFNPPHESKPRTWFHAMSGNMSKEGLTKDLESIADVGIGGVLLFNVSQGIPVGDVPYNSDRHHEMLTHAAAESERLGLSFGFHNCDGWSSSGGPWVKPEESMKMITWTEKVVSGSASRGTKMPQPTTREGFYRDIALLAYPSLPADIDDDRLKPTVTSSDKDFPTEIAIDGKIDLVLPLGKENQPAPWLQFSYPTPKTIRSASARFTDRHGTVTLQQSADGEKFTDVLELRKVRTGKEEWAVEDRFDPVTARYFRMQFNQPMKLMETKLTAHYFIGNRLNRISMARREDWGLGNIGTPGAGQNVDPASIINLTGHLDAEGRITYDLPDGEWTVMRFGQTSTGAVNVPASVEGQGLEVDKMSRPAFKHHYDSFVKRVLDNAKPVAPNAMQYVEIDSYEMGGQTWTDGFDSLFQDRKGYDFIPFLPLIAGRFMEAKPGGESATGDVFRHGNSEAVLYDFREVVSDLFTQNYFKYFTELCHADGIKSYVEPYGFGPVNDLDVAGTADIPMTEFWMNKDMFRIESTASGAHIYGKPIISAEAFTSRPEINWRGNPTMGKVEGDKAWAIGVNEFMFHRFAHQANTKVTPGMTMNRYGFHFDRTQTWWYNAGAEWFRYMARGSYLLRQGYPVADMMIFIGDGKPNSRFEWDDFKPNAPRWLNYDNVNTDVLLNRTTLEGGSIVLPEGGRYPMLALKNCDHLSLPTLRRLVEVAESGVTVIGAAPSTLAGHGHTPAEYEEFSRLTRKFAQLAQPLTNWAAHATAAGVTPDLVIKEEDDLIYEHRRVGDVDIYYFVNTKPEGIDFDLDFRAVGQPEHWDAVTGKISKLARYTSNGSRTRLRLKLKAEESAFIVFRDKQPNKNAVSPDYEPVAGLAELFLNENGEASALVTANGAYTIGGNAGNSRSIEVDDLASPTAIGGPWQVTFLEENGFAGELRFPELTDWKDHPDERVNYYSGTATYRTTFVYEQGTETGIQLDLGEVDNFAEVRLNGKKLGVLWMPPFQVDISGALRAGENELEIEVTNLWSNRLIGEERFPKQDGGYEMDGNVPTKKMPQWYVDNEPVPPGPRTTFTTADFYDADDDLFPSGMKGPVRLLAFKVLPLVPASAPTKK